MSNRYAMAVAAALMLGPVGDAAAEPLVATYEVSTSVGDQTQTARFVFARDDRTVLFADARKTYRDIWDQTGSAQQLRLRRVVDLKRASIEFLPNELALREHTPKWESLQSPFGQDVRGNCADRSANVVECVPGDTLPAQVTLRLGAMEVRWSQVEVSRDAAAFAAATGVPDDYALWDAADFGDQEYDRDLQMLLPYAELDAHSPRIHALSDRPSPSREGHRH